ncbi:MAG: type IX secretion system sortase PorU [candidate division Zixibacteria bacterium]|nr:type IX secretion system sortase PorU [candidate division Zixibacteria bacterium]
MRHLIFRAENPLRRIKTSRFFIYPDLNPLDMTKRIILPLILFCLILPVYVYASDEYSDIQIIRSDEKGIVFRYKVPELTSSKYNKGDTLFDILGIDKCPLSKESGYPQVPARIVVIGIPLGSQIDVRVLEGNSLEKGRLNLPRFEERVIKEEEQESRKLQEDIYNKDVFYPEKIVSFDSPTFMRNQRILRLKIFPVQYNPLRKTVKYYSDITIAVDFSGGEMGEGNVEKDLFENVYRETVLNYEIAKNWRKTRGVGLKKVLQVNPFSYSDTWYKITLQDNGVYKLDGNYLANAGITLSSIDPQKIRIFNGGGKVIPLLNRDPRPDLKEIAILVSDGGDNKFDPTDFILFYGWSVNRWEYDSTFGGYKYYLNPYTRGNVFWFTLTGDFPDSAKRMEIKDGSLLEPDPFISTKSKDRVHMESDVMLAEYDGTPNDYFQWYWKGGTSFTLYQPLSNIFPGDTAVIKVRHTYSHISSVVLNSTPTVIDSTKIDKMFNYITTAHSIDLDSGLNTFQINFPYWTYLDYYEIDYWKKLVCSDNQLWFENQDTSEVIEYRITGFNGTAPYLFEIGDRFEVKVFENYLRSADTIRFQNQVTGGEKKQFYLADQSKFKTPLSLTLDQMADLRNVSNQADLLVITHSDFYDQLLDYKSLRENLNLKVGLVEVQDIYDEFSWGLFDPVAIRDFLKYAYENWEGQAPAFALLVGDGTYDYRDLLGTHSSNWIPPFVANPSIDISVSDDNYAYFGNYGYLDEDSNRVVDMFIGRWPVKTNQDVQIIINKIKDYETSPELNTWRNLITLVADDEFGPPGINNEWEHTVYTESLSKEHIQKSFNLNKIYLMEYPKDVNGKKPEAEEAVVDAFNNGTVIINYMGHGNPNVWAHEYVFKREQDIPRLKNKRRLPLVYVASCSIGNFYNPYAEGMGEEFLRAEEKGAISVISATWLVYATENAMLNYKVYDLLLRSDSVYSISEALYIAKLLRGYNGNDRQYILIGDPLTFLASPELQVRLKDMNPDTLSALGRVNFKGEVTDRKGNLKQDFNGTANILAFDSERQRTHMILNQSGEIIDSVKYTLPGNVMFRGNALVQNGEFTGNFIVPKDIGYGGKNAKISAYVVNTDSSLDGAGALDSLIVAGTDTTVKDSLGPQISILFEENLKFTDGDTVQPNPTLVVYINDPQGINLTGELGHGITLTVDDDWENMQDLTSNFQYDLNNYTQGSLKQKLNLKEAEHTMKIKAWDNANNSTLQSFLVKVLSVGKELSITQAMNYPNPFSRFTQFTYELSVPANKVEIKIFTLSGRLIKILSGTGSPGFNSGVIWDGRDEDGDKVANGVYIYKIMAETKYSSGGKETTKEAEVIGKAVVMN